MKYIIARLETHRGGKNYNVLVVSDLPLTPPVYEPMGRTLYTYPEAVEKLKELESNGS